MVPLRFFLTAPWFGVLAGLLLVWSGEDAFSSRWSLPLLAITHLLTTGFMLQVICGALLQFIPVVIGSKVPYSPWLSIFIQPLLALSALVLTGGFAAGSPRLLVIAASGFVLGIGIFAGVVILALWPRCQARLIQWVVRCSLISLVVTIMFGTMLAASLFRGTHAALNPLISIHLIWGLAGWALLLLVGVSWYVIPMFQLTPAYPVWFKQGFLGISLVALGCVSFGWAAHATAWTAGGESALLIIAALHALLTLWLQARRRRKINDSTLLFFRFAMVCLLTFALAGILAMRFPALMDRPDFAIGMGMLALVGVFTSVIIGMLYKILPFLGWLHLRLLNAPISEVPNMKGMLAETAMRRQLHLHLIAFALLFAGLWLPWLVRPAGLMLAISYTLLSWNLVSVMRYYKAFRNRLKETIPIRTDIKHGE